MKTVNSTRVARECGVSQATVSRVINNSPKVSSETRRRVLETARRLNYPMIPQNRRLQIGMIWSRTVYNFSFGGMKLMSLQLCLSRLGHRLEVINTENIALFNERLVNGVVGTAYDPGLNRRWIEHCNIPMVRFSYRGALNDNIPCVYSDTAPLMEEAVDLLWKNGHRRIVLLLTRSSAEEGDCMEQLCAPFIAALERRQVENPERFISLGGRNIPPVEERIPELVQRLKPTAFISIPVEKALAACTVLRRMGLKIPQDISFITNYFYGVTPYLNPPFTSLCFDYPAMAECGVDLLLRMIGGERISSDCAIPGSLFRGGSVAAAPKQR